MKQLPLKRRPFLKFLTTEELEKLNTKRLLGVLSSIRAVKDDARRRKAGYGICCNICNEWILSREEYQRNVNEPTAHLTAYKERIKKILSTREHIS